MGMSNKQLVFIVFSAVFGTAAAITGILEAVAGVCEMIDYNQSGVFHPIPVIHLLTGLPVRF